MPTKRSVKNQKYENYWKLTLEYSDIFGEPFNNVLDIMVNFIDEHNLTHAELNKELYAKLQNKINSIYHKVDMGSTRKSINQFIKLGFIEPRLNGYHALTRQFIREQDQETKQELFSKIVYQNSKFNSSVTTVDTTKQVNFLIKTLAYSGPLSEQDLCTLISIKNINNIGKGFLTRDEIEKQKKLISVTGFDTRKYNQKRYLYGIAKRLSGVFCRNRVLSLRQDNLPDAEELKTRDPYLHSLYKKSLKAESCALFGKIVCDFTQREYTSYVASHIKPFHLSDLDEQYNTNNGLLLSLDIDALFDKFDITFNMDGVPLFGERVSKELCAEYKKYQLDKRLLNPERIRFLKLHNEMFNKKNNRI